MKPATARFENLTDKAKEKNLAFFVLIFQDRFQILDVVYSYYPLIIVAILLKVGETCI